MVVVKLGTAGDGDGELLGLSPRREMGVCGETPHTPPSLPVSESPLLRVPSCFNPAGRIHKLLNPPLEQLGINQRIIPLFVDYAIKIHLIFDFRDQVANSGIG